jgi:hypothetical protein
MIDNGVIAESKCVTVCKLCCGAFRVTNSALAIGPPTVDVKLRAPSFVVDVERDKLQCFYAT